jgi:protein ImuB
MLWLCLFVPSLARGATAEAGATAKANATAEADALAEIATLALAFSPQVSIAPPAAVLVEISGSVRLFGGLTRLFERLTREVKARDYPLQTAIAPVPAAAILLARPSNAGQVVVPVITIAQLPAVLASLPLTLLDLDPDVLDGLQAAGVTTLGAARRLPRAPLARRFGPALVDALDRAYGSRSDPREPYRPPPRFERRLVLPSAVETTEAIGFAVHRLSRDLSSWLAARGLGVLRVGLTLSHERRSRECPLPPTEVVFAFGAPARAPAHLDAVLRERLARVTLTAPVDAIVLASVETAPLAGRSLGLLPDHARSPENESAAAVVPLVERLRSRLSDAAVIVLETRAEHRPEYAMGMIDAGFVTSARSPAPPPRAAMRADAPASTPRAAPRPLWLLDEARPLGCELERKPWVLRDGPERIESGWWDGRDLRRDYFVAESTRGETAWIYRDHRRGTDDGDWFLHGLFA